MEQIDETKSQELLGEELPDPAEFDTPKGITADDSSAKSQKSRPHSSKRRDHSEKENEQQSYTAKKVDSDKLIEEISKRITTLESLLNELKGNQEGTEQCPASIAGISNRIDTLESLLNELKGNQEGTEQCPDVITEIDKVRRLGLVLLTELKKIQERTEQNSDTQTTYEEIKKSLVALELKLIQISPDIGTVKSELAALENDIKQLGESLKDVDFAGAENNGLSDRVKALSDKLDGISQSLKNLSAAASSGINKQDLAALQKTIAANISDTIGDLSRRIADLTTSVNKSNGSSKATITLDDDTKVQIKSAARQAVNDAISESVDKDGALVQAVKTYTKQAANEAIVAAVGNDGAITKAVKKVAFGISDDRSARAKDISAWSFLNILFVFMAAMSGIIATVGHVFGSQNFALFQAAIAFSVIAFFSCIILAAVKYFFDFELHKDMDFTISYYVINGVFTLTAFILSMCVAFC